jgi:hypothetical protein
VLEQRDQEARQVMASIRSRMDKQDYDGALAEAKPAAKKYADTSVATQLHDLREEAQRKSDLARDAQETRRQLHESEARDALAAVKVLMTDKDYAGAITKIEASLREYSDTPTAKELRMALELSQAGHAAAQRERARAATMQTQPAPTTAAAER